MRNIIYLDLDMAFKRRFINKINSKMEGIKIIEIHTHQEILREIERNEIDFIIVDFYSLEISALHRIKEIRMKFDKTIIVLNSFYYQGLEKYLYDAGANFCIDKKAESQIKRIIKLIDKNQEKQVQKDKIELAKSL